MTRRGGEGMANGKQVRFQNFILIEKTFLIRKNVWPITSVYRRRSVKSIFRLFFDYTSHYILLILRELLLEKWFLVFPLRLKNEKVLLTIKFIVQQIFKI